MKSRNSQVTWSSQKFQESLSLITLNRLFSILNIILHSEKIIFKTQFKKKQKTKENNEDRF